MNKISSQDLLLTNFQDTLLLEQGLSKLSIKAYVSDVMLFAKFLGKNNVKLENFQSTDVEAYLNFCKEKKSRSISRFLCSMRTFSKFLIDEKIRKDDPLVLIANPKFAMSIPPVMSEQCVSEFLEAPDLSTSVGLRDKAMLEMVYATGLRVSELVNLKFENINFVDGFVLIRGKGNKERIIPFGDTAAFFVEKYVKEARVLKDPKVTCPYIFLSSKGLAPMTRIAFWYRVKVYAKQIGLLSLPSPHTFRHAFATHLLNHDADLRTVQMLLGHSSLTITQIYTHVATARMHSIYDRTHPRA